MTAPGLPTANIIDAIQRRCRNEGLTPADLAAAVKQCKLLMYTSDANARTTYT